MSRLVFAPLEADDYGTIGPALDAAGLPIGDLHELGRSFFQLFDNNGPIGFVGLERLGHNRLLRSLVVLPGQKWQGHGGLLVAHAEAYARNKGAQCLHLLTEGSADFFRARGYRPADRRTAPPDIAACSQFTSPCPASAVYLVKELA